MGRQPPASDIYNFGKMTEDSSSIQSRRKSLTLPEEFLLSIVTINRNNAGNLEKTLESLRQIPENAGVEFIFIDGASTDDSVTIARNFYPPKNITSEPDTGVYNAMNKGLHKSCGKFIMWLNSGDELLDGCWPIIEKHLTRSTAAVLVFGIEIWSEDGRSLVEKRLCDMAMLESKFLPHPSSIFRRRAVLDRGGYDESYRISGDRHLFMALRQQKLPFEFPQYIVSRFYLGGLSSHPKHAYLEDRRVDLELGLIGRLRYLYLINKHRLYLALRHPFQKIKPRPYRSHKTCS